MDLPFLYDEDMAMDKAKECFNPYSNGSSFFIEGIINVKNKTLEFQSLF